MKILSRPFHTLLTSLGLLCILITQACSQPVPISPTGAELSTQISGEQPGGKPTEGFSGPIKIAIVAPMTGPASTFGASTLQGARLAINEWNARGGVLGVKVVALVGDSQCDRDAAATTANQLINLDKVHYIVGDVCSSASLQISELAESEGVVQISPSSTLDRFTLNADNSTKQFVFRACYTDSFQGVVISKFALDHLKIKRAFILYNPVNDYTVGLANTFEETFTEGGGQIVGKETYNPEDSDFSTTFDKINKASPEIIFLGDGYPVVNFVISKAREYGIDIPFIGADGWDSPNLDKAVVDGSFYSTHFSPQDQRPMVQEWQKKYQNRYHSTPDALAALGYDATNILLASIAQAGVDDPQQVAEAMAAIEWVGVSGTIVFDEHHNPIKPAVILQVEDGDTRYITTVSP